MLSLQEQVQVRKACREMLRMNDEKPLKLSFAASRLNITPWELIQILSRAEKFIVVAPGEKPGNGKFSWAEKGAQGKVTVAEPRVITKREAEREASRFKLALVSIEEPMERREVCIRLIKGGCILDGAPLSTKPGKPGRLVLIDEVFHRFQPAEFKLPDDRKFNATKGKPNES